jgi:hypothetical protein
MLKKLFTLSFGINKNLFISFKYRSLFYKKFNYSFSTKQQFESEEDYIERLFKQTYSYSSLNNFDETENSAISLIKYLENNKFNNALNINEATLIVIDNYIKQEKYSEAINYINDYLTSLNQSRMIL